MSDKLDEYRRTSLEGWEATAAGWTRASDTIEQTSEAVREWLLRELDPQPGDTVLELAAGAGQTGFEVARLVGERGRVLSTDFSPTMVEAARRRSAELGLANVEHRVMDAERMDLGDDFVDGVVCRFGYMLMADPAAALAETRRVLRPGGRLALGVWGPPDRNPVFSVLGRTLVQRGHLPAPDPLAPGPFSMASEERIRGLLEGAGFASVRVEEVPARFAYTILDEYFAGIADTSAQISGLLAQLPAGEHEAVRAQVEAGFEAFRTDGGYDIPGVALCAVAA